MGQYQTLQCIDERADPCTVATVCHSRRRARLSVYKKTHRSNSKWESAA